jgi:hypothetical protein
MSYNSTNLLPSGTSLARVFEIIKLLGYIKTDKKERIPNLVASYYWYQEENYESFVGVELHIYKYDYGITIDTRSRSGRSYWDLEHQNKTIRIFKDFFGGKFETDAGKSKFYRNDMEPLSKLASGLFIARSSYHNSLIRPNVYLSSVESSFSELNDSVGISFIDSMNPKIFSNNLLIPYLAATWEEYLKSSYIVLLKCTNNRERIFKGLKLSGTYLKDVSEGFITVEEAIADGLSFQRPKIVADNFKMIEDKLDIYSVLRKPYKNRKTSLFESIDEIITLRNEFVHSGRMSHAISSKKILIIMKDFEEAADRIYTRMADFYNFAANERYLF